MRGIGFEPMKALSQQILSLPRLTASLPSHKKHRKKEYKKIYFLFIRICPALTSEVSSSVSLRLDFSISLAGITKIYL